MNLLEPRDRRRARGTQPRAAARRFQGKAHHDVGRGELVAGEPWPLRQLALDIVEMHVDHRLDTLLRALPEQGHAAEHQHHQQRRHHRPLGIMKPEPIAQRRVAVRRRAQAAIGLFDQIFDDSAGFGDDARFAVGSIVGVDDHRRLAERMDGAQLGRGQHRRLVPRITLDLIAKPELLEHPQDALRARVFEVMDDDHRSFSCR